MTIKRVEFINQYSMLFNLIEKLPIDFVGATILHYLDIKDIVRLERACCSKASHQHFLDLIPHSPAIELSSSNHTDIACFEWFSLRRCKIKSLNINLPGNNLALHVKQLQVGIVNLSFEDNVTMDCCNNLFNSHLICQVKRLRIYGVHNEEVVEQLSRLTGNIETLHISGSFKFRDWLSKDILSRWKLKELSIYNSVVSVSIITLIGQTCTELTSIALDCSTADDAVVMAIAQHCPKLQLLVFYAFTPVTCKFLLVLSEYKLPLKELYIDLIPNIPTADIARRCSHALSCIRRLNTNNLQQNNQDAKIILPYMTGLNIVRFKNVIGSYMPLLAQYCSKLTTIHVHKGNYPVSDILSLCSANPLLQELMVFATDGVGLTDTVLIELIHACPHLHTLYLPNEINISDIVILALSEHCPQLQFLVIRNSTQVTERAVLHLLQCCHKLTRLGLSSSSLSEETWTQLDKNTQKRVSRC